MSSILKALKKLENKAGDQSPVRLWQQNDPVQNAHQKRLNENVRFNKHYFIMFVGLIFAVGAGMFLSQKVFKKKPELTTKRETLIQKTNRTPEKNAPLSDSIQKKSPIRKDVNKPESIQQTAPVPAQKLPKNAAVVYNKELPQPKPIRKEPITEQPVKKPEQKTTSDPFTFLPVKQSNETRIELQAIAWAKDPKNRLAVINGIVLREGESIDNATVMHIGKDEVILRKEGVEWKQLFGF